MGSERGVERRLSAGCRDAGAGVGDRVPDEGGAGMDLMMTGRRRGWKGEKASAGTDGGWLAGG